MTQTILIVEDERDLVEVLQYNLEKEGYTVKTAMTGADAMTSLAARNPPDLVLLDLMLPDISGLEICKHIRSDQRMSALPVIMLTAKGEEIDRVVGFELGADDYVTKPFSVREVLLRIRALLRRADSPSKIDSETDSKSNMSFGPLKIDRGAHRVWVDNQERNLTVLEFDLLVTLLSRRGRVQTRDSLLADVWDINADVTTRTVDTHVKRLREKIGKASGYIETVRGVGYRFADAPPSEDP